MVRTKYTGILALVDINSVSMYEPKTILMTSILYLQENIFQQFYLEKYNEMLSDCQQNQNINRITTLYNV